MVSFVAKFMSSNPAEVTASHVVDHILHIAARIGFDHIGIGSDYDGTEHLPKGLEDVSKFGTLVEELLRRGVAEDNIEKILGLNIIRVLQAIENVAQENKTLLPVLQDSVKPLWNDQIKAHVRSLYPNAV